jgi:hypothetical protein
MLGRIGALAALALMAACGSVQPAGRNSAREAPPPPPPIEEPAPTPAAPTPSVAAPGVSVATPAPQPQPAPQGGGGGIVVPGQVERQVPVPDGDPRSAAERMADIRAWDRCVMQVQGQGAADPTRPQLDMPEDVCRNELGMNNRTAVPNRRR